MSSNSIEDLKTLCSQRKWYDCAQGIILISSQDNSKSIQSELVEIFKSSMQRMHPKTLKNVGVALCANLQPADAINIFKDILNCINSHRSNEESYLDEIAIIEMSICLCRIKLGEVENRETEIIEWKNNYKNRPDIFKKCSASYGLLQLIAYNFYKLINNIEETQKYLLNYIEFSKNTEFIPELIKLSIVSKTFFDFSTIISLSGFESVEEEKLTNLIVDFQQGDCKNIKDAKSLVLDIIKSVVPSNLVNEYVDIVGEKVFLASILSICFEAENKSVSFDKFINELSIDESYLISLILKALGMKLVSGWIDSKERMLYFNSVMPRCLYDTQISKMKNKFICWRDRIAKVIETLSSE